MTENIFSFTIINALYCAHMAHMRSAKVIIFLSIFHIINRNLTISSRQFEALRRDLFPSNTRFQYLGQFNYKLFG